MNLSAGSDPSLNFPKPFPFSQATKPTKQPNNHRRLTVNTRPATWPLGAIATQLTCSVLYQLLTIIPPYHHSQSTVYSPSNRQTTSRWVIGSYLLRNRLHRIRFYPYYSSHTDHTSAAPQTRYPVGSHLAARLHRNFIPIWLSYPIEITHTSPDILYYSSPTTP